MSETSTEDTLKTAAALLGRQGGLKGGPARAAKLTPERRQAIAKIGGQARAKKLAQRSI